MLLLKYIYEFKEFQNMCALVYIFVFFFDILTLQICKNIIAFFLTSGHYIIPILTYLYELQSIFDYDALFKMSSRYWMTYEGNVKIYQSLSIHLVTIQVGNNNTIY